MAWIILVIAGVAGGMILGQASQRGYDEQRVLALDVAIRALKRLHQTGRPQLRTRRLIDGRGKRMPVPIEPRDLTHVRHDSLLVRTIDMPRPPPAPQVLRREQHRFRR